MLRGNTVLQIYLTTSCHKIRRGMSKAVSFEDELCLLMASQFLSARKNERSSSLRKYRSEILNPQGVHTAVEAYPLLAVHVGIF